MTKLPRQALKGAPLIVIGFPSIAISAEIEGDTGLLSGFLHPLLGFDHFLAMIAVGLLSLQISKRAVWLVPAAFVMFLAIGGALGLVGTGLPQVEGAIALSVFGLGLIIALNMPILIIPAMLVVGCFAIFHGHAHGVEIPELVQPMPYVIGFLSASILLHLTGVGLGLLQRREAAKSLLGAGCAGIGLHMLLLTYSII